MVDRDDAEKDLARLREAIDRIDEVLVRLLNQRAKYAVEIGELKGHLGLPIYAPDREKQVLNHAEQTSAGPLEIAAMRRLFERIIDETRRVEREASSHGVIPSASEGSPPAGDSSLRSE